MEIAGARAMMVNSTSELINLSEAHYEAMQIIERANTAKYLRK